MIETQSLSVNDTADLQRSFHCTLKYKYINQKWYLILEECLIKSNK